MKVIRYLDNNMEKILVAVILMAMSVIIGIQVFMRYVMSASLSWSEEIARYLFIWLVYIGISYGVKTRRHIKVDAAMYLFPYKLRPYVSMLGDVCFLIFAILIVFTSYDVTMSVFATGQNSPAMQIPMGYVYIAPLIGFIMVAFRLVQRLIHRYKEIQADNQGREGDAA